MPIADELDLHRVALLVAGDGGDQAIRLGGDIITEVDGRAIRTEDDLVAAISGHKQGDTVKIQLVRDGHERTVEVELASRPTQTDGPG